jgi:hypothetical protein
MKRLLILVAALAFSAGAAAQLYKWKDKDGKIRYGDTPPPGAEVSTLKAPAGGTPPPAGDAAKAEGKAEKALSPEAAFQKRQQERESVDQKGERPG